MVEVIDEVEVNYQPEKSLADMDTVSKELSELWGEMLDKIHLLYSTNYGKNKLTSEGLDATVLAMREELKAKEFQQSINPDRK